jgi:hypothetical protein
MARRHRSPIGISTAALAPRVAALTSLTLTEQPATPPFEVEDEIVLTGAAFDQVGTAFALPTLTAHSTDEAVATAAAVGAAVTVTAVAPGTADIYVTGGSKESNHVEVVVAAG